MKLPDTTCHSFLDIFLKYKTKNSEKLNFVMTIVELNYFCSQKIILGLNISKIWKLIFFKASTWTLSTPEVIHPSNQKNRKNTCNNIFNLKIWHLWKELLSLSLSLKHTHTFMITTNKSLTEGFLDVIDTFVAWKRSEILTKMF